MTGVPPVIPLTELTSTAAAHELMTRIRAATRSVTPYGGWPPNTILHAVVAEWLAEFGLRIDDEPTPPVEQGPQLPVAQRLSGYLEGMRERRRDG